MTRKHFILLAQQIALIPGALARYDAAKAVATACKGINPSFDRTRFYAACGVSP